MPIHEFPVAPSRSAASISDPAAVAIIAASLNAKMPVSLLPPRHPALKALPYVLDSLSDLYLHNCSLADLILQDILPTFYASAHAGFCYTLAATSMLALRDNPTSHIVYVNCQAKGNFRHAWVEFELDGLQWVLDTSCRLLPLHLRDEYYLNMRAQPFCSCSHAEFWSLPVSLQFAEKLHTPESSYLFPELVEYYSWYIGSDRPFHCYIAGLRLPSDAGRRMNPLIMLRYPELFHFQQTISQHLTADTASLYAARRTLWRNYLAYCRSKQFCS